MAVWCDVHDADGEGRKQNEKKIVDKMLQKNKGKKEDRRVQLLS